MNLRQLLRGKKDLELRQIVTETEDLRVGVERRYNIEGGISLEQAELLSEKIEESTVAIAVGRERKIHGGHNNLGVHFDPNPKKQEGMFGRMLRKKRGAER